MGKFIKAARFLAEDENGFVIGEADTYEEVQAFGGRVIDTQSTETEDVFQSRKNIKSSQKGFENVAEGTQYDDYHIDTKGQGILSVENIIDEIESRGNQAVLTVQTSDGSTNHSQFGSEDWKEYKDSVNDAGNAITDVWVTEVESGSYVRNSRKLVKSSLENDSNDLKNKMESMSGEDISRGIKKTIRRNQKPMLGIKYNVLDQNGGVVGTPMSYEDACDLADDIDGEVVPVYSSRRPVKSAYSTDNIDVSLFEDVPVADVKIGDEMPYYVSEHEFDFAPITKIDKDSYKGYTFITTDEFGSGGLYIDTDTVTIKKRSVQSSRRPVESTNYNNLEKELVTKILSGKLNEEKAARVIAMSKKCNLGYAKQILSTWIEERSPSLIKNGVRHVVLNNAFDPDGNIDSWSMDFVPQSGMADTKAGEILRAFNQIQCSWFNHGYKVGDYRGSEYVNSAARFLKSHTDEKISKLLESATRCHDIESYDNMIQSMRTSLENYLCNNSHLFQSVNEEDMWDEFSPEDNDSGELDDVKLVNGNSFIEFKNEDGSWVCTKINVDTEYNEGDTFTLEDDIAENFEPGDGEYGDFVFEGIHYSWESLNDNEYRINGVSFEDDYFVEDSDYTSDEIISYCADNPDWVLCNKDNDEVDMDYFN